MAVQTFYDPKGSILPQKAWCEPVTNGSQAATEYIGPLYGKLDTLYYTKASVDGYANGVGFTITKESTGENIWVDTNINASEAVRPRVITQHTDGADNTTLVIREPIIFAGERIKIVIASGGAAKTGKFTAIMA